ncbi:hypothetical protein [Aneurinibacillus danicus]|jgi:hypothetical protein|uniref:Uncharacterized protein n=1 Tax=Aneurinibacillus danicus TaxID=267746 RepID=A0A511V5P9_9BACL|nr:hypothetical protein [Aneurinibacillus danicus]GEN33431.1 hypothetical protein ADA01nite_08910 [Aneurinibacillus danicus]
MTDEWRTIKPEVLLPAGRISPGEETMGDTLNRLVFQDIYRAVSEDGARYFPRLTAAGDVEICIVYEDIESFSEQVDARVYLDFSSYRQNWIAVLWVVTDPEDPLGYPLSFRTMNEEERYLAVRFLEQEHVWVHYLADIEEGITHLYSEAISFSEEEKEEAGKLLLAAYRYDPVGQEEEEMPEKTMGGEELAQNRLLERGFAFYFDYRLMENRFGEEGAREQVMGAVYRSLWMMHRHPNAQARDAELLIWVGEKTGKNRAGEDTRLLVVAMTPQLLDVYQIVHMSELEANPLATMLMALTEYQYLEEEYPLEYGYIPIVGYDGGTITHIEWNENSFFWLDEAYIAMYPEHTSSPYRL